MPKIFLSGIKIPNKLEKTTNLVSAKSSIEIRRIEDRNEVQSRRW
jgi:hypothetical protein